MLGAKVAFYLVARGAAPLPLTIHLETGLGQLGHHLGIPKRVSRMVPNKDPNKNCKLATKTCPRAPKLF